METSWNLLNVLSKVKKFVASQLFTLVCQRSWPNWGPQLPLYHQTGISHTTRLSPAQEKFKIQTSKYNFYWMPITFMPSQS